MSRAKQYVFITIIISLREQVERKIIRPPSNRRKFFLFSVLFYTSVFSPIGHHLIKTINARLYTCSYKLIQKEIHYTRPSHFCQIESFSQPN